MTRTLSLSEVKIKLSQLVQDVIRREDEIVITRSGKPAAVLVSAEEYESWKETQEIKQNSELMREIRQGLKAFEEKERIKKHSSVDGLFGTS